MPLIRVHDEVKAALAEDRPVVALETTLVTHGLPPPRNLETAKSAEAAVRKAGAVPATVGVLDGEVVVGLSTRELEQLAKLGMKSAKAGARDLAALATARTPGSTTVAATLAVAARVGIRLLATGGIGGVHRDWTRVPDLSGDLFAMARSPVGVVSSGFKSVLDLAASVEALEALGVPVVGYGTDSLPGFYLRETPFSLEHTVEDPESAATLLRSHWVELGRPEGVLFAQPVPAKQALSPKDVEPAVSEAVLAAAKEKITGKALTPFLLDLVVAKLGEKALEANTALILANARTAGDIAVAFHARGATRARVGF